jgi:hypothetical protein
VPKSCPTVALALVLAASAFAQEEIPAAEAEAEAGAAEPEKTTFALTFSGDWIGSADFDETAGDVSISRLGADFGVRHAINPRLALRFGAGVEHSVYDFSGATGLVSGTADPYNDVTITVLSLGGEYTPSQTDAWFFGGFVRSAGEGGSDFGDTISGGVTGGYRHAFSESFALGVGAAVGTELEGDVYVIPFPIIDWRINDRWRLGTGERAGLVLSYKASDRWTLGAEGGYERREYRLDENGPLPSGVVDERRVPVAAFATFSASENFVVTGRVGTHLLTNFEFENAAGNKISEDDAEAAIGFGVDLTVRF